MIESLSLRPSKPLDAMNRLSDMTRFPAPVHAGATFNVLVTIALTLAVYAQWGVYATALPLWIAFVLCLNLMPVAALRSLGWRADAVYPAIERMDFFRDQHRFPDWVYLAASADMAFWIALEWCAASVLPPMAALLGVQALALVVTFAPVWVRPLLRSRF